MLAILGAREVCISTWFCSAKEVAKEGGWKMAGGWDRLEALVSSALMYSEVRWSEVLAML